MKSVHTNYPYTREQDLFILEGRERGEPFDVIATNFRRRFGKDFSSDAITARWRRLRGMNVRAESEREWLGRVIYRGDVALPRMKFLGQLP